MKFSDDLKPRDFETVPIWKMVSHEPSPRGWKMAPVRKYPVKGLNRCWIFTPCKLANGDVRKLVVTDVNADNARLNYHVAGLATFTPDGLMHLSRYYGPELEERGADAFAAALGLQAPEVFPVGYDLREFAVGNALVGEIEEPPTSPLSREEVYDLIIKSLT